VKRFLFPSSGGTVYGTDPAPGTALREDMATAPRNAYGASKLAIEHYLRLLNGLGRIATVSLRISNAYGEGQRAHRGQGFVAAAIRNALAGAPLEIWGDGSVERDFVHVSDVARAFVMAAHRDDPPPIVNIGSGVAVSLSEIVRRLEDALGQPVPVVHRAGRVVDVKRNVLDISRARATLGWTPEIRLEEGLARTVRWWRHDA